MTMGVECNCDDFTIYAILPNGEHRKLVEPEDIDLTYIFKLTLITNNWRRYRGMKPLRRFRKKGQRKYWKRFKSHAGRVSGTTTDCVTSSDTL